VNGGVSRTQGGDKIDSISNDLTPAPRPSTCWNCGKPAGGIHFCEHCRSLQPPSGDCFEYLGLPRKLQLDAAHLETAFYSLSRAVHPDVFFRRSEQERKLAEEATARLNDAYRVLKNSIARAEHLLDLEGVRTAPGESRRSKPKQSDVLPELLEEVFDLKLELEQARQGDHSARSRLSTARTRFQGRLAEADRQLEEAFAAWDRGGGRAALNQIDAILNWRSFAENLLRDLDKILPPTQPAPAESHS